jgi:hypothetical protein
MHQSPASTDDTPGNIDAACRSLADGESVGFPMLKK